MKYQRMLIFIHLEWRLRKIVRFSAKNVCHSQSHCRLICSLHEHHCCYSNGISYRAAFCYFMGDKRQSTANLHRLSFNCNDIKHILWFCHFQFYISTSSLLWTFWLAAHSSSFQNGTSPVFSRLYCYADIFIMHIYYHMIINAGRL